MKAPEIAPRQELEPGNRVRVHLFRPRSEVTGNVVRVAPDTLVILSQEDPPLEMALSAANIEWLELSRGQRSRARTGALVGLFLGAVGGAVHSSPSARIAASAPGLSSGSSLAVPWSVQASARESGA